MGDSTKFQLAMNGKFASSKLSRDSTSDDVKDALEDLLKKECTVGDTTCELLKYLKN